MWETITLYCNQCEQETTHAARKGTNLFHCQDCGHPRKRDDAEVVILDH